MVAVFRRWLRSEGPLLSEGNREFPPRQRESGLESMLSAYTDVLFKQFGE